MRLFIFYCQVRYLPSDPSPRYRTANEPFPEVQVSYSYSLVHGFTREGAVGDGMINFTLGLHSCFHIHTDYAIQS